MNRESKFRLILLCALAVAGAPGLAPAQTPPSPPSPPAPAPAAKAAEPIGRLFFTPAQRVSLDVARTQRARTALSTEKTTEEAAPVAQTVTYSGMVKRSDGKSTVWINGRPVNDNDPVGGASIVGRVRSDGSVLLQVPQSGRSVDLKPGQSIELLSGTIEEGYSRKPVVPEAKPAAKPAPETKPAPKPAQPDRAAEERSREERDQQRIDEAVARALQDKAGASSGAASSAPTATPAR